MSSAIPPRIVFAALAFVGLVAAAPESWTRVSPPKGGFSVETPCTEAEVEKFKSAPEELSGFKLPVQGRVICLKPGLILLAGEISAGDLPASSSNLFDMIVTEVAKDPKPDGKPTQTTLAGHRAMLNREVNGQRTAQVGFIELGRSRIIMIVTGFLPESTASLADQGQLIDRYFGSIAVTGQ
jgi:hypothetical protein